MDIRQGLAEDEIGCARRNLTSLGKSQMYFGTNVGEGSEHGEICSTEIDIHQGSRIEGRGRGFVARFAGGSRILATCGVVLADMNGIRLIQEAFVRST